jgi:DNA-binding NarL/FixJ family response regulator
MQAGDFWFILETATANEVMSMHILLADDQSCVRFGLRVLLERQPGFEVVGGAADALNLLAQAESVRPDLVLLDWGLPGMKATDMLPLLRAVCPAARVIVLSGRPEARRTALAAGADGFVGKYELPERLLAAIAACGHGLE